MRRAERSRPAIPSESILAAGALVAGFAWLVAPGAAFFDSGELATTALDLGVPHPTGFPLLNLAGHAIAMVPLGPASSRVHLLGAVLTVAAALVWLVTLLGSRSKQLPGETWLWLATLAVAVASPSLVRHAIATEVYPLVLLHAACLALAASHHHPRALAFVSGLVAISVGIHAESVLLAGLTLIVVLAMRLRAGGVTRLGGSVAAGLTFVAVGGLVIAYLPLAATRPAGFSWGDVTTPAALWDHLSAASIRRAFDSDIGTAGAGVAVMRLGAGVWRDIGYLLPVAGIGVAAAWRDSPRACVATGALIVVDALYSVLINPMGLVDQQCGLIVALGLGALAARGCVAAVELLATHGKAVAVVALVGLLSIAGLRATDAIAAQHPASIVSMARWTGTWLQRRPAGQLVVVSADHTASGCVHAQVAEGQRPDVLCMPGVFARQPRMLKVLARTGRSGFDAAIVPTRKAENVRDMAAAMAKWLRPPLRNGPVGWELGNTAEDAQVAAHFRPGFPAGEVTLGAVSDRDVRRAVASGIEAAEAYCGVDNVTCPPGSEAARFVARWASVTAARLLIANRPGPESLLDAAIAWSPRDPHILNNRAVWQLSVGDIGGARKTAAIAMASPVPYAPIYRTATRAALAAADVDSAITHAKRLLELRHHSPGSQRWLRRLARDADPAVSTRLLALVGRGG